MGKTATTAFGADVIAVVEAFGKLPVQVHENELPLSTLVAAWADSFEHVCADHSQDDGQIATDAGMMATDVRALRDFELELRRAAVSKQQAPSFKKEREEIVARGLTVISRLW